MCGEGLGDSRKEEDLHVGGWAGLFSGKSGWRWACLFDM